MQSGISTHVLLQQRLSTGILDAMTRSGAQAIQVFAARHHFDYTDRSAIRDLAGWFRSNPVTASLHQPLWADAQWSRHVTPTLNLIDPEKSRRIAAQDEVKRAIESAEQIPFTAITLHLGLKHDPWNLRALENSLSTIEHLKAFAHPLGVRILLENLQNDVTTPEHLLEILRVGHFDTVGIHLDIAHAHLAAEQKEAGITAAFAILGPKIAALDLSDNHGLHDEHLWPVAEKATTAGTIDWRRVVDLAALLKHPVPALLEIAHDAGETAESFEKQASKAHDMFSRITEQQQSSEYVTESDPK